MPEHRRFPPSLPHSSRIVLSRIGGLPARPNARCEDNTAPRHFFTAHPLTDEAGVTEPQNFRKFVLAPWRVLGDQEFS